MLSGKELSTDPRVESPQFDISDCYGDTAFQNLFIKVYKHSFKVIQRRLAKYVPVLEEFKKQYHAWKGSTVRHGQAVPEWKFKETFEDFPFLIGAFDDMDKQLHALQEKAWVADTKDVDIFIKTRLFICDLGTEILKNRSACDTWADDVKGFGNLHVYSTLGQLTNNVGSKKPCRLQRAVEKLCTIHFQVNTLIRFACSRRMRFMLSESTLDITQVEPDAPTNKQPMPSTEKEWRKVLDGILDRHELELHGSPQKARAIGNKITGKAHARQGRLVKHCECLVVAYFLRHNSPLPFSYIGCSTSHVSFGCRPSAK